MPETQLHSPAIAALACRFRADSLRLIHQGEGLVFDAARQGAPVILKVISGPGPAPAALAARMHWIQYLNQNGLLVPRLIPSSAGGLVEEIDEGGIYYAAYAYHKVPLDETNKITWREPGLSFQLGAVMARMHRLAVEYTPPADLTPAGHWHEAGWLHSPEKIIHPSQGPVIEAAKAINARLHALPVTTRNYGLIHDDLHTGNVFNLDGRLFVLDFDLLHYSWFAADLASALLFRVWIGPAREQPAVVSAANHFLREVIRGCRSQAAPPDGWQEHLPLFLKLRELSLFQSFYRDVPVEEGLRDPFFRYVYESLAEDRPFLPGLTLSG